MQLGTVTGGGQGGFAAVVAKDGSVTPVSSLIAGFASADVFGCLDPELLAELAAASTGAAPGRPLAGDERFDAPYRRPGKILGIGLNYREHAGDLGAELPRSSPASFFKGDHTIIGPGEPIRLPVNVGRVTAEGEVALVVGRTCYQVDVAEAMDYVAGITAVLDQTAEEVLLENPRFLTRVKNYPTFFSFGPTIMTLDELVQRVGTLDELRVATVRNGVVHRQSSVSMMTFSPAELLSFHSHVMPLHPGDLLSTGTPGAIAIDPGDVVSCVLGGVMELTNPVGTAPV